GAARAAAPGWARGAAATRRCRRRGGVDAAQEPAGAAGGTGVLRGRNGSARQRRLVRQGRLERGLGERRADALGEREGGGQRGRRERRDGRVLRREGEGAGEVADG